MIHRLQTALSRLTNGSQDLASTVLLGLPDFGKSYYILQRILDLDPQYGLMLLDPHGDLARHVLRASFFRGFADRLVYVDPTDPYLVPGINPLEVPKGRDPETYAMETTKAFKKIWGEGEAASWGPKLESVLRNSTGSFTDPGVQDMGLTLLEVQDLLTNNDFRQVVCDRLTNPDIRHFWQERYNQWGNEQRLMAESTLNKLDTFLTPAMRLMVGQSQSTIDFREIMDNGKILVINLNKPTLKDGTYLLGTLILVKALESAFSRAAVATHERRPFLIAADEAHNLLTSTVTEMTAEGRKFGLHFLLATQTFSHIPNHTRDQLLGTTKYQVSFAVDRADAEILAPRFWPADGEHIKAVEDGSAVYASIEEQHEAAINALTELKKRHAYMRERGGRTRRIKTRTIPDYDIPADELQDFKREIMQRHARPQSEVIKEIERRRQNLGLDAEEEIEDPTEF